MKPEVDVFAEPVDEYLAEHNVLNLSTSGEGGPWAAAVFYAHSGRRFWFMSNPNTLHGSHIVASGAVAASVHEDCPQWKNIRGLQMKGRAWVVEDPGERKVGLRAYFRKYDFAEAFFRDDAPEEIRQSMQGVRLFCFEPELVLWLDNSHGFSNRARIHPPE